jgi:phenylalanyl-tRNA synthetase beta chain
VVDTVVCMFSQYCKDKFTAEACEVITVEGTSKFYPDLSYRNEVISADTANAVIGIRFLLYKLYLFFFDRVNLSESPESITKLLNKMCLKSELKSDGDGVKVTIPPTRHDIMHPCDIYEDVAIAYAYNKIPRTLPKTNTIGEQTPVNKLSDLLRGPIAQAGFTEALTFSLVITNICT